MGGAVGLARTPLPFQWCLKVPGMTKGDGGSGRACTDAPTILGAIPMTPKGMAVLCLAKMRGHAKSHP